MNITYNDMFQIQTAMGKHVDLLQVVGNKLHLSWWTNSHVEKLVVTDFSGHRNYYFTFIRKVLNITKAFNEKEGCTVYKDSKEYLQLRNVFLNEENK